MNETAMPSLQEEEKMEKLTIEEVANVTKKIKNGKCSQNS